MRKKVSGNVTVRAISGTHVIFLALNMREADARGLMGFAIQRTDFSLLRARHATSVSCLVVGGIHLDSGHRSVS